MFVVFFKTFMPVPPKLQEFFMTKCFTATSIHGSPDGVRSTAENRNVTP